MTTKLPTYDKYKPSGVEWLGEIPEHWQTKKLKFLGKIYAGLNGKKGDDFSKEYSPGIKPYIPFTNICNNIKISDEQFHFVKVDEKETQTRVLKNDILFLMSSETLEDIAKCSIYLGNNNELYINSFCKGFRFFSAKINPEFINYLFLSSTYRSYFSLVGRGFTRINLKQEFINDAISLIPPLPEQTAIAQFLDHKTALIDQAIDIKQKQIELLKERRQILIHQAVTQGLNPEVKMKDSGVEWIGEVPEGWEVVRLKTLGKIRYGLGQPPKTKEDGLPLIRATNVERGRIVEKDLIFVDPEDIPWERDPMLKENDIIVVRSGAYTGDSAIIPKHYAGSIAGYDMVLTPTSINPRFLSYTLLAKYVLYDQLYLLRMRAAQPHLNAEELGQTIIVCPPKLEQQQIFEYLENISKKIATAITLKQQEIAKLQEYKATLINSAVTGKIKVGSHAQ